MTTRRRLALAAVVVVIAAVLVVVTRNRGASAPGAATVGSPLTTVVLAPGARPATTVRPAGSVTASAGVTTRPTAPRTTASHGSGSAPRGSSTTRATTRPPDGMRTVKVTDLPGEARETLRLISSDGPFPYRQDGVVFENREHHLPVKAARYYHEYTVVTPGSPDRGARRIITGGDGNHFYTDDHYASFRLVVDE